MIKSSHMQDYDALIKIFQINQNQWLEIIWGAITSNISEIQDIKWF